MKGFHDRGHRGSRREKEKTNGAGKKKKELGIGHGKRGERLRQ
jgi:hypothetical protein